MLQGCIRDYTVYNMLVKASSVDLKPKELQRTSIEAPQAPTCKGTIEP